MPTVTTPSRFDRFFAAVKRLNSLLLALALLAGVAFVAYLVFHGRGERHGAVTVPNGGSSAQAVIELNLSPAREVFMTDTEIVELSTPDDYKRYANTLRNALFVSGTGKAGRWLFEGYGNVIKTLEQLREGDGDRKTGPTLAHFVAFRPARPDGTPGDGTLLTVGLAKPDGSGFTTVLSGVVRVLSHRVAEGRRVIVLFHRGTAIVQAEIALDDFKVIGEREVARLPAGARPA